MMTKKKARKKYKSLNNKQYCKVSNKSSKSFRTEMLIKNDSSTWSKDGLYIALVILASNN